MKIQRYFWNGVEYEKSVNDNDGVCFADDVKKLEQLNDRLLEKVIIDYETMCDFCQPYPTCQDDCAYRKSSRYLIEKATNKSIDEVIK